MVLYIILAIFIILLIAIGIMFFCAQTSEL